MSDLRITFPLPPPDELEAELAQGLRVRDHETSLRHFWILAAHQCPPAAATSEDLLRVHGEWRELCRSVVEELVASAEAEARRVERVLASFPEEERSWAWTHERMSLSNQRADEAREEALRVRLLGADFHANPAWIARFNAFVFAGNALHDRVREDRVERALRGELDVARNKALELAVLADPGSPTPRRVYADWLAQQQGGRGLAEHIALSLDGPARSWRAKLLLELDDDVLGALGPFEARVSWDQGLITEVSVDWRAWRLALDHPAAMMLHTLRLAWPERRGAGRPPPLGAGPWRLSTLGVDAPPGPHEHELVNWLVAAAPALPLLRTLHASGIDFVEERARLAAAFPQAVVTFAPNDFDDDLDDDTPP